MTDFQKASGASCQGETGNLRWCPVDALVIKQLRQHLGDSASMRIVYEAVCYMAGIELSCDICKLSHERAYSRAMAETGRYQAEQIDALESIVADEVAKGLALASTSYTNSIPCKEDVWHG